MVITACLWSIVSIGLLELSNGSLLGLMSSGIGDGSYVSLSLLANGSATVVSLAEDKASSVTSDSAMDMKNRIHYLFEDGYVLRHFNITAGVFSKQIYVDLDPCTGGGECVDELFWDPHRSVLLTVAMGLHGSNTLAKLDPITGKLVPLPHTNFSQLCGLVEGGAAYDAVGQMMYVTLDCAVAGAPPGATIYSFDVSDGAPSGSGFRVVLSAKMAGLDDLPGRLTFGAGALLGFMYDSNMRASTLVSIEKNATKLVASGIPGGIDSRTTSVSPYGVLYGISGSGNSSVVVAIDLGSKKVAVAPITRLSDSTYITQVRAY